MFPWNIAKSAEAMFSRWAIKRVCKFFLKKKLGEFILGDIDLDQLDVQLTNGTIQLSDLVINVDYINQKFGAAAAVIVKEGSIGSLLVTMPWKGKGCQIEVDELELVLAPCGVNNSQVGSETYIPCQEGNNTMSHDLENLKYEMMDNSVTSAPVDVHEGVKTIAKMVKWLLTSFHVKVKRVIVAFDPCLGEEKYMGFCKTLVFRITEAECGTCISEDVNSNNNVTVDTVLGFSRLTNFIKFQGAILEFLQMDSIDNQTPSPCSSGTTFGEWFSGCCPLTATTPIVTGDRGGFSGTLKLSIPWKNGSLDIRKVDADACIDPLEVHHETSSADFCLLMGKETIADALLPGLQLIPDWVSSSISKNQKDRTEEEPYFGARLDQFFECFDEMRNSQSALGNSGMWNWTCSVFSAITAASNLASGSLHMPTEQQHVETNLKATFAGISVFFSFLDEERKHLSDLKGDQMNVGSNVHYLGAKCKDMLLVLKVCPQEMKFEAMVEHIELTDNFSNENGVMDLGLHGCNDDIESQIVSIKQLQDAVQGALLPFSPPAKDADLEKPSGSVASDFPSGVPSMNGCTSRTNSGSIYRDDVVKFIALDFSSPSNLREENFQVTNRIRCGSSWNSVLWQEGPVTGPWIAKRAKILATSEDLRSRNKPMGGKGYEFASVTTVKDTEDFNARTRKDMILSSAIFLHVHLSYIRVNLGSSQYRTLHCLLCQVIDGLSCTPCDPAGSRGEPSVSQTSILVECDSVEISISLEKVESIKGSIQNELPGSWHGLKLQIQKFELLYISNIGGIGDANFLWVAHGEGSLWGSITGENEGLLLISCSNSTKGRGDGEGSNVLSSRFSGSDIIHLWDPESFHSYTSVTVRCGTIVAVGGRLDWLDIISSFFSLPSPEIEQAGDNSPQKGEFEKSVRHGSSFVLKLVDIGLSYEPYLKNLVVDEGFKSKSGSASVNEEMGEKFVACLLAASSLKLSNKTGADSVDSDYKIRVQDLGLLLCPVSGPELVSGMYGVEHLRKIGYVKVAREAHVEALLRMNSKKGLLWEVESSESHIFLETCHDSTSGLIRLAAQLQQLFAPDVEESVVHLQTRNVGSGDVGRGNNGWYGDAPLRIVENHVLEVTEQAGQKLFVEGDTTSGNHIKPENYGKARGRVLLKNINLTWRMYSGSDWDNFRKNVLHSGITRGRDTTICLELALSGMDFRYDIFPDGDTCVSRISLSVQDFHLNDKSNDALWKLILGYYQSKDHPRESSSKAFKLDLEAVRPDPSTPLEEYRLRIAFLPMRLHLHQSQLDFLISFFGGSSVDQPPSAPQDGESQLLPKKSSNFGGHTIFDEALLPYFQKFDIWPVLVRVDYVPCRIDLAALRGGNYVELVNLVPWKGDCKVLSTRCNGAGSSPSKCR
ncbi:hypothetical protein F0562_020665 [Nyssa sinensis]|uniref:Autophagy-related protein 2 n=1 Tax=Nyssa sinensis TaxID=561372 RepID=A0A5J5BTA1_9ASTE|nr:hypothetical protein F0562_020665 [Nyssa sinensis]